MSVDAPLIARPHPRQPILNPNPRRRPASSSVSLRHSTVSAKANSQAHTASSLVNNNGSPANSSNSQTWFDTSNNNPVPRRTSPIDHEPPFFLPDSSSGTPHNLVNTSRGDHSASRHLLVPGPPKQHAVEGTMDDFRSVIDDLTVQNKKLLKRLRRYERSNTDHLHSERMFEVKVHGLSATKKLELEETLKRFALGLADAPSQRGSKHASAAPASSAAVVHKPTSSLTSTKFADSGYGSMTASNRPAVPRSSSSMPSAHAGQSGTEASRARERNIHSYLHDIPEGLLPRESPAVMTDDAKKRLVVARLEQLFHGSGATADGHQQPIQQQEVSRLAARDDRSAMEARGQRAQAEGCREARIMEDNSDASAAATSVSRPNATLCRTGSDSISSVADTGDLEQRPTRPLDLDPHRAQDPLENVGYIRHLGFQMSDVPSQAQTEDSQGWIYLNLLVSMAQLHTLNVTTSLVTDALRAYSSKFELSEDSRKIRWNPSRAPNAFSVGEDQLSVDAAAVSRGLTTSGVKRPRPSHFDSTTSQHESRPSKKRSVSGAASSRMSNTPMRPHSSERNLDNDDDEWAAHSDSEELLPSVAEYPNQSPLDPMNAAMSRSTVSQDDGTLIFFKNPRFFLDLSGCRAGQGSPRPHSDALPRSINSQPLGSRSPQALTQVGVGANLAPPFFAPSESGSLEVHTDEGGQSKDVHHSDEASLDGKEVSPTVFPLEASGLGHVYPSDNFVVFVTRDAGTSSTFKDMQANDPAPPAKHPPYLPRLVSVDRRSLSPSQLPSPTYAVTPDDDNDNDDDDDDSSVEEEEPIEVSSSEDEDEDECISESSYDVSVGPGDEATAHHPSNSSSDRQSPSSLSRNLSGSKQSSNEDDNMDDAQSLDFLATARAVDPAAIEAREREYDADLAERLAEQMPAGSSAATCGGGGGSGYNSPATGIRRRLDRKGVMALDREQIGTENGDEGSVSS